MIEVLRGVIPVAPTVFHDDESLDLAGQRRVIDFLVDTASDGVCLLANYSEQFSLTDEERDRVVDASLEQLAGRARSVVTVSHYSARVTRERARRAQAAGADIVMLMPPFVGAAFRVSEARMLEYFHRISDGLDVDVMIQDAPVSGVALTPEFLARVAVEVPRVRYVKVEVPGAAEKIGALGSIAGADLPGLYDGEEAVTLLHDLDRGAVGTMCSASVPDLVGAVVRTYAAGDRPSSAAQWESILPLLHYENRQCGLAAAKVLLHEGGMIGSPRTRHPLAEVSPATRAELIALARRAGALVLREGS